MSAPSDFFTALRKMCESRQTMHHWLYETTREGTAWHCPVISIRKRNASWNGTSVKHTDDPWKSIE